MRLTKKQKAILGKIHDFVKRKCIGFAEDDVFSNHILSVRDFAVKTAKMYDANVFIVTAAAYLHDISYIMTHDHDTHEVEGSKFAMQYLKRFNLPEKDIRLISNCILNHRGSKKNMRKTIEEKIVACADAMDHISRFQHMFYRKSRITGFSEAIAWNREKMKRSWKKVTLKKARELIRDKYELASAVFKG